MFWHGGDDNDEDAVTTEHVMDEKGRGVGLIASLAGCRQPSTSFRWSFLAGFWLVNLYQETASQAGRRQRQPTVPGRPSLEVSCRFYATCA